MKIYIFIIILFLTKYAFSQNIYETKQYILEFNSENINDTKNQKIDNLKIQSFKRLLIKILTKKNFKKLETRIDNNFVNNFILNIKINDEKIINKNYYSKININFNKNLLIDYFIDYKIPFNNYMPKKFLIIIYEDNIIEKNLLSKKNKYYNFLLNSNNPIHNNFLIPNLDINDRFILNKNNINNDLIKKIRKLNSKYNSDYQIVLFLIKEDKYYNVKSTLIDSNNEYLIEETKINNINLNNFFDNLYSNSLDKWKELNQVDPNLINQLKCFISINNINEIKFLRKKFKYNRIIKNINLNSVKLNQNLYNLSYYGNFKVLKNSLSNDRLNITLNDSECRITLK